VLCLVAFGLSQRGVWPVSAYPYLVLNFVGGWGLSAAAVLTHQWGFVLLEGVWGAVAGWSIGVRLRGRQVQLPVP
jgi:hypothetical protein